MEILCENKQYPWQIVRDGFVQFHRIFEGPPGRCEVDNIISAQIIRPPWQYIPTMRTLCSGVHTVHTQNPSIFTEMLSLKVLSLTVLV